MSEFALKTALPAYLRDEQERIEKLAAEAGLDFFPTVFEILTYDQMNEIAAYGGFPNRYPHWRFGMEYERLAKSYEYGLSKIYEMVINNNPSYAYLLEGNSLVDQKLVMAHVYAHVDFFKNNFCFRVDRPRHRRAHGRPGQARERATTRTAAGSTRWPTTASRIRRARGAAGDQQGRGVHRPLPQSLENLIDLHAPFTGRRVQARPGGRGGQGDGDPAPARRRTTWSPSSTPRSTSRSSGRRSRPRRRRRRSSPSTPSATSCMFLLEQRAARALGARRPRGHPRGGLLLRRRRWQTKIMNEGWATYWHSKLMTEKILDASARSSTTPTTPPACSRRAAGGSTPTSSASSSTATSRSAGTRASSARSGRTATTSTAKKNWNLRLGLGQEEDLRGARALQRRHLHRRVPDARLLPRAQALHASAWSNRNERYEIETREFKAVKEKLLFQLTNGGNPFIYVEDANFENRGELLLRHDHQGLDLRQDYAQGGACGACVRVWKRPVNVTHDRRGQAGDAPLRRQGAHDAPPARS